MINRVVLVGRITRDPELRKTSVGISVVRFTLAVNRRKTKEGDQEADFINCQVWRHSADFLANYVKKGAMLGIEGRIQTRSYKDQNDRTVYVTEVVCESVQLLAQKQASNVQNQEAHTNTNTYQESPSYQEYGATASEFGSDTLDIASDDLPF